MRLLLLTPDSPFPPHKGTAMRNFHLLVQAARRHEVHLLTFVQSDLPAEARTELSRYCRSVIAVPRRPRRPSDRLRTLLTSGRPDLADRLRSPEFATALTATLAATPFDLVQIEGLEMAPYLDVIPAGLPTIYDAHNAEHRLQQRAAAADLWPPRSWPRALYSLIQWQRLLGFERRTLARVDAVIAVSPADRAALQLLSPGLDAAVIPNGIDAEFYASVSPASVEPPTLIFIGTMDFRPNVDAVVWFCEEVLPRIRSEISDCRFLIVGQDPTPEVQALAADGVVVTGRVADVRPFLSASHVYVVPVRIGGGTRFKVPEALAAGLPVVSTTVGAEGIGVAHGRELLLADAPAAFATAVLGLLSAPEEARRLAAAGRTYVRREFDWATIAGRLEAVYERMGSHPKNSPSAFDVRGRGGQLGRSS